MIFIIWLTKHSQSSHFTLNGYRGYLSNERQVDLLPSCKIRLKTPTRSKQKDKETFAYIIKKLIKRIETLFTQLCDQFKLKGNYAKPNRDISVCTISKITETTVFQYYN